MKYPLQVLFWPLMHSLASLKSFDTFEVIFGHLIVRKYFQLAQQNWCALCYDFKMLGTLNFESWKPATVLKYIHQVHFWNSMYFLVSLLGFDTFEVIFGRLTVRKRLQLALLLQQNSCAELLFNLVEINTKTISLTKNQWFWHISVSITHTPHKAIL